MKRGFFVGPLVFFLVVLGCNEPTAPENPNVQVRTDRSSYRIGDTGTLTVRNRTPHDFGITPNFCGTPIQRRVGDGWEKIGELGRRDYRQACLAVLQHLPPRASVAVSFSLDEHFQGGNEYRFFVNLTANPGTLSEKGVGKYSNTFTVKD